MKINARWVGNTLRPIVGFFLTVMGGFVAALNLATMFPSETYEASWGKVVFATAIAVFGGVLNKSNKEVIGGRSTSAGLAGYPNTDKETL